MRKMIAYIGVVVCSLVLPSIAGADPVYVDAGATGNNDGSSWVNAYTDLPSTVAGVQAPAEIWVAAGTHYGTVYLRDQVKIYGGFTGTETSAMQSDPAANPTYIDGQTSVQAVVSVGTDSSAVLRGFHIVNGRVTLNSDPYYFGGGAYLENSSAKIVRCVFSGNVAETSGGAVAIDEGSPTFVNCDFHGNTASMACGAVYSRRGATPTFINCLFCENEAPQGGAVCQMTETATFTNCTFADNSSTVAGGGALLDATGEAVLRNCILWNNSAGRGDHKEIYNMPDAASATVVTYSDVDDDDSQHVWPGMENKNADPLFLDASSDNYHLSEISPCKDEGNDADIPADTGDLDWDSNEAEPVPFDLDGVVARVRHSSVDMGAYEFDCQLADAPTTPSGEAGYAKNRYVSFVPGNSGENTALRVSMVSSQQFPGVSGYWWVGQPHRVTESSWSPNPPPPLPAFWAATVQCQPYYTDWHATIGAGKALHVYADDVVPDSTYEVQALHEDCTAGSEAGFSEPLTVTMSKWGDVVGVYESGSWTAPDGMVYMLDVVAVQDKFSNKSGAPIKARADLVIATPDRKVRALDFLAVLDAFGGDPYPYGAPVSCP